MNPNFYELFAEVLGKETGFSKGMGGFMHLFDQSNGLNAVKQKYNWLHEEKKLLDLYRNI